MSYRTKTFTVYKWKHNDRQHTIEILKENPNLINFEMGFHLTGLNPQTWSLKILSRAQKQLRQELYNYLSMNNLPTNSYILNVEGASMIKNDNTYIRLHITSPTLGDLEANKAFCDTFTDKMYEKLL